MILVDSSVLVDYLRGDERARAHLTDARDRDERLLGSMLSKIELLAGMRDREESKTRALFDAIDWVPVDDRVAERAGAFARRFLRSHPGIDTVDYVIAGTVEEIRADLWTRNTKHFPMFPDLRPPY